MARFQCHLLIAIIGMILVMLMMLNGSKCDDNQWNYSVPSPIRKTQEEFDKCVARCEKHKAVVSASTYEYCQRKCLVIKPRTEKELYVFAAKFNTMQSFLREAGKESKYKCLQDLRGKGEIEIGQILRTKGKRERLTELRDEWDTMSKEDRDHMIKTIKVFDPMIDETIPVDLRRYNKETISLLDQLVEISSVETRKAFKIEKKDFSERLSIVENRTKQVSKLGAYEREHNFVYSSSEVEFARIESPEDLERFTKNLRKQFDEVINKEYDSEIKALGC